MKVIMLDFDGTINPFMNFSHTGDFSKVACSHIQTMLVKMPELRIVVSSSWRTKGLDKVRDILKNNGIDHTKVIDVTEGPKEHHGKNAERDHHILHWLDKHPEVENYVIIDDEAELPDFSHKYVKPNPYIGLTEKNMQEALKILEGKDKR